MEGRKDDGADGRGAIKPRYDLLPPSAVEQIVQVLNFGAIRYADDNWQKVPQLEARYYAALQRHLTAWRKGEMYDTDSGLPHLAHAGCCLLFLLSNQIGFDRSLTRQEQLDADVDELLAQSPDYDPKTFYAAPGACPDAPIPYELAAEDADEWPGDKGYDAAFFDAFADGIEVAWCDDDCGAA